MREMTSHRVNSIIPRMEGSSNEAVAWRLELLRTLRNKKKYEFAKLAGVTAGAYTNYLKGERLIDLPNAIELAKATKVTLDWIYFGTSSGMPSDLHEDLNELKRTFVLQPVKPKPRRANKQPRKTQKAS